MMALDLGLHKSTGHYSLVDHERRVRVFWNIYVYEKLVEYPTSNGLIILTAKCQYRVLAAEMGRPVMIRMVHCDPVRLSEEQSDEYETVVHPATGTAVRPYVSTIPFIPQSMFRRFSSQSLIILP